VEGTVVDDSNISRRRWVWPTVAILVVLATLGTRATLQQQAAWTEGVTLEQQGDIAGAVAAYRSTLRWYTPWGPVWQDAAEALVDLANRSQGQEPERALLALEALRSGLVAARSLWQPRADLLDNANRTLPELMVRVAERQGDTRNTKQLLAKFQADYERPVGVGPLASLAVLLGFLTWAGCLVAAFWRGVDDKGRLTRAAWTWGAGSLAGLAVWLLAMGLA
jgi:hypothetical protein